MFGKPNDKKQSVNGSKLTSALPKIPKNDITNVSKDSSQQQPASAPVKKSRFVPFPPIAKNIEEPRSASTNEILVSKSSNKREIKSSTIPDRVTKPINNDKLTQKNQLPENSNHNAEQPASKSRLRSLFSVRKPSDDVPTTGNQRLLSSQDEKIPFNRNEIPVDIVKNNENQQVYDPSTRNDTPKSTILTHDEQKLDILDNRHPSCQFHADKSWLDAQYHDKDHQHIKKPDEIENEMNKPPVEINEEILNRIQGSMIGMALGDALGAHVEFRPHSYLVANPVTDLGSGGTWGLKKGQFTDDTSMALCLANSLVARRDFVPYDQLVRYKWWSKSGYMSSTGQCFDIGDCTRQSIVEFERRQREFAKKSGIKLGDMDYLSDPEALKRFNVYCSEDDVAGNGALMGLAPVPLFFYRDPAEAVEFSGQSGQITHGDRKAYDACRYYGALIVAALHGETKNDILDKKFYRKHKHWFGENELHPDIKSIVEGSYKKEGGYDAGIRGKGYIVAALEAALWAFWSDNDSFEKGALAAVNLGEDTDTTAAIYGQLAGAYYGYKNLPEHWLKHVYGRKFMEKLSKWIAYEGERWQAKMLDPITYNLSSKLQSDETIGELPVKKHNSNEQSSCAGSTPMSTARTLDLDRCLEWTCDDVCEWVKSLGEIYATYVDGFKRRNVNGYDLLNLVKPVHLTEFGVTSSYNCAKLADSIKQLRIRCGMTTTMNNAGDNDFNREFDGDYVPPLHLTDTTYPNTLSCTLRPAQSEIHSKLYTQVLKWLGPLPSNIDIGQIEFIHNSDLYRTFCQQIKRTESRQIQPEFQPHLDAETNLTERKRVLNRLQSLTQQVRHNKLVPVVRVWHACNRANVPKVLPYGFAALSQLDDGWFGTGMYFTSSAEYASKYTNSDGCLIMCYVVLLNPFPVIAVDAPPDVHSRDFRFSGKGNYSNYQCHYIPVAPVSEGTQWDFRPPPSGVQNAPYDELVVFQQADILPQVIVHLKPRSTSSTAVASIGTPKRIFLSKE